MLSKKQHDLLNISRSNDNAVNNLAISFQISRDFSKKEIENAINQVINSTPEKNYVINGKNEKIYSTNTVEVKEINEKNINNLLKNKIYKDGKSLLRAYYYLDKFGKNIIVLMCDHVWCDINELILFGNEVAFKLNGKKFDLNFDYNDYSNCKYSQNIKDYDGQSLINSSLSYKEVKHISFKFNVIYQNYIETIEKKFNVKSETLYEAAILLIKSVLTSSNWASIGVCRGADLSKISNPPMMGMYPSIYNFNTNQSISDYLINYNKNILNHKLPDIQEAYRYVDVDKLQSLIDLSFIYLPDSEIKVLPSAYRYSDYTIEIVGNTISIDYPEDSNDDSMPIAIFSLLKLFLLQLVKSPYIKLKDLKLCTKSDYDSIRNYHKNGISKSKTVQKLFKETAVKNSDKVAVIYGTQKITYKDLDYKSTILARKLSALGIHKNNIIAVADSGIDLIIDIIALMKIGAIYLPISNKNPQSQNEYTINTLNVKYILADDTYSFNQEKNPNLKKLDRKIITNTKELDYDYNFSPEDVLYIIQTSGTTGKPKNVQIKNNGVANLAFNFKKRLNLSDNSIVQQFADKSFDASMLEIYGTVLNGFTLVIVPESIKKDPKLLQTYWNDKNVDVAIVPTIYFKFLDVNSIGNLKVLISAGEAANADDAYRWNKIVRYVNAYGPSETTVWATTYCGLPTGNVVPIGKPNYGFDCIVIRDNKECGIGVHGELCISGNGLFKGYYDDLNKTNDSLVTICNKKYYKTGDIVYWNKDLDLVFVCRIDNQVKINGHRIEIDDIESKIRNINGVKECCVLVTKKRNKNIFSVFYTGNIKEHFIKDMIRRVLPNYLVPDQVILLDNLPLNKNGKIDKKELSTKINKKQAVNKKDNFRDINKTNIVENSIEDVLGINLSHEDLDKSFNELGGDSINAMELSSILYKNDIQINASQILEAHEIKKLTDLSKFNINKFYPTTLIQKYLFSKHLTNINHYNQSLVLEYEKIDTNKLKNAIEYVVNNNPQLRCKFSDDLQYYSYPKKFKVYVDDIYMKQGSLTSEKLNGLENNLQKSLDIFNGKVFASLIINSEYKSTIIFVAHHLIIDGISWRAIVRELEDIVFRNINKVSKNISFEEYNLLNSHDISEIEYHKWKSVLKNIPSKENRNILNEKKEYLYYTISNDLAKKINGIQDISNIKINEFLLATFIKTLLQLRKKTSLMLETHGRSEEIFGSSTVVGWFTRFFPMVFSSFNYDEKITIDKIISDIRYEMKTGNSYLNYRKFLSKDLLEPEIIFNYFGNMKNISHFGNIISLNSQLRSSASNSELFGLTVSVYNINDNFEFEYKFDSNYFDNYFIKKIIKLMSQNIDIEINRLYKIRKISLFTNEEIKIIKNNGYSIYDICDINDLLPMQKNLLFKQISTSNKFSNNIQVIHFISGKLDRDVLVKTINLMYKLIPSLRYRIIKSGSIFKIITLKHQNNSNISFIKSKKDLENLINVNPINTELFGVGVTNKKIIFVFNHLTIDGQSLEPFINIFDQLYKLLEKKSFLTQNEYKRLSLTQSSLKNYMKIFKENNYNDNWYWNNILNNFKQNSLDIPLKFTYKKGDYVDKQVSETLPFKQIKVVKQTLQSLNISFDAYAITLWGILLRGYSLSNDILIGKIVSGRNLPLSNLQTTVGMFINNIPVRICNNNETNLLTLIQAIQLQTNASIKHLSLSLAEMPNISGEDVEAYFSHEINNENFHDNILETHDDKLELTLAESNDINVKLNFNGEKYHLNTMKRIVERYVYLLINGINFLNNKVKDVPLINEDENKKLLSNISTYVKSNSLLSSTSIYDLFKSVANYRNSKIAINCGNNSITYKQLLNLVDDISNKFIKFNIKNGTRVVVQLDKSIKAVATILALAKLNAIYIPIDVMTPNDRVSYIIKDSGASIIITNDSIKYITHSQNILNVKASYIIYTSGTTGNPKGVVVAEKGLINIAKQMKKVFNLSNSDVIQQFASFSFDASLIEIYTALLNGLKLVIIPDNLRLEPNKIVDIWNKENVTLAILTPSMLKVLPLQDAKTIVHIKSVGETLNWPLAQKLSEQFDLVNGYGPTETTVWATYWRYKKRNTINVPIGSSIDNVICLPINNGHTAGIDMPGELYIGGNNVALGYLNNDKLNKEKFVVKDFCGQSIRFYKSGDLVRLTENDGLEYLGRKDNQVKIRGNRIELGEIEMVISKINGINESHVVLSSNKEQLIAFIIGDSKITKESIRNEINNYLPSYMIPNHFLYVNEFPKTINGKIDDRKLLGIYTANNNNVNQISDSSVYDDNDKILLNIINKLFPNETIGINDNFIEIGGQSLLAMKLVSEINDNFDTNLSVLEVLNSNSIKEISDKIKKSKKNTDLSLILKPSEIIPDPPKRLFTIQEMNKKSTAYNLRALIKIDNSNIKTNIKKRIEKLTTYDNIFKTNFKFLNRKIITQLNLSNTGVDYKEINLKNINKIPAMKSFNLKNDNLLRLVMIDCLKNSYLLVETHHAICDGRTFSEIIKYLIDGKTDFNFRFSDYKKLNNSYIEKELNENNKKVFEQFLMYDYHQSKNINKNHILKHMTLNVPFSVYFNYKNRNKKYITESNLFFDLIFSSYFNVFNEKYIGVAVPFDVRNLLNDFSTAGMFTNSIPIIIPNPNLENININDNYSKIFEYPFISFSEFITYLRKNSIFDNPIKCLFSFNDLDFNLINGAAEQLNMENDTEYDFIIDIKKLQTSFLIRLDYNIIRYKTENINDFITDFRDRLKY